MTEKRNILTALALHVGALIETLADRREDTRAARREIVLAKREIKRAKRERAARAAKPIDNVSVVYTDLSDTARSDFEALNFLNAVYQAKLEKRAKRSANKAQYSKRETRNKRRAARKVRVSKSVTRIKIGRAERERYTELAAVWYSRECERVSSQVDKGIKPNTLWWAYAPDCLDNGKARTLYAWAVYCDANGIDVSGIRFKPSTAVEDTARTRRIKGSNKLEANVEFGFGPAEIRPNIPTYIDPPRGIRYTLNSFEEIEDYTRTRRADSRQLGSSVSRRTARPVVDNPYTESGKLAPMQTTRSSKHYSESAAQTREAQRKPSVLRCADGVIRELGTLRGAWEIYFRGMQVTGYRHDTSSIRCADGVIRELGTHTLDWVSYFGSELE